MLLLGEDVFRSICCSDLASRTGSKGERCYPRLEVFKQLVDLNSDQDVVVLIDEELLRSGVLTEQQLIDVEEMSYFNNDRVIKPSSQETSELAKEEMTKLYSCPVIDLDDLISIFGDKYMMRYCREKGFYFPLSSIKASNPDLALEIWLLPPEREKYDEDEHFAISTLRSLAEEGHYSLVLKIVEADMKWLNQQRDILINGRSASEILYPDAPRRHQLIISIWVVVKSLLNTGRSEVAISLLNFLPQDYSEINVDNPTPQMLSVDQLKLMVWASCVTIYSCEVVTGVHQAFPSLINSMDPAGMTIPASLNPDIETQQYLIDHRLVPLEQMYYVVRGANSKRHYSWDTDKQTDVEIHDKRIYYTIVIEHNPNVEVVEMIRQRTAEMGLVVSSHSLINALAERKRKKLSPVDESLFSDLEIIYDQNVKPSLLWYFLSRDGIEEVEVLLTAGYDLNRQVGHALWGQMTGIHELTFAACRTKMTGERFEQYLDLFLEHGVDLNALSQPRLTALQLMLKSEHINSAINKMLISSLLRAGVNVNPMTNETEAPLILIAHTNYNLLNGILHSISSFLGSEQRGKEAVEQRKRFDESLRGNIVAHELNSLIRAGPDLWARDSQGRRADEIMKARLLDGQCDYLYASYRYLEICQLRARLLQLALVWARKLIRGSNRSLPRNCLGLIVDSLLADVCDIPINQWLKTHEIRPQPPASQGVRAANQREPQCVIS